tara:strand:+ start:71273 stop:73582 length:2310 start_codon:yes stop_codon:yes gene_type:complete
MINLIKPHKTFITVCLFLVLIGVINSQSWSNNGPFGGFITALVHNLVDTTTIYAGTFGKGLYKSTDNGENWFLINNEFPLTNNSEIASHFLPSWWYGDYFPVTLIRIDASNTTHILAGTIGSGIIQSYNGGENWVTTNVGLPDSAIVSNLWLHPENSSIIYCGLDSPNGGLYRSLNGGVTWELVEGVPHGSTFQITTITNELYNSETMYVGIWSAGDPPWGLLRSIDGGYQWETVSDGMPIFDLQINPIDNQNFWGIAYTGWEDWVLTYSNDQGNEWTHYPTSFDPWLWITGLYADADWNLYAVQGALDEDNTVYKSPDYGESWQELPIALSSPANGIKPGYGPNIASNPLNTETVYFGTYSGVFKSNDGGNSVEIKENGMVNSYIYDIKVNPQNPDIIFAGGFQGLWKSVDGGENWIRINTSEVMNIAINPINTDTVYWGGSELMRSYDGGETWQDIRGNIMGTITAIDINPVDPNILFVGSYFYGASLYKSENYGNDWVFSFAPLGQFILDIETDKNNPQTIYIGGGYFYKTTNGGIQWYNTPNVGGVNSIIIDPIFSNTIYVGIIGDIKVSYNGAEDFQSLGEDIPSEGRYFVSMDPLNNSHILLATRDEGIFHSLDSGNSWNEIQGPYNPRTTGVDYVPSMNKIYVATHGGGVWVRDSLLLNIDSTIESNIQPDIIELFPAYPNPFNDETVISFITHELMELDIGIYNIKGQLLRNLSNQPFLSGYHQLKWNGTNDTGATVTSGIYLMRINNKKYSITKKLVFLK